MTDTALYRKYRPHTFADVRGQEHIVSVLEGALRLGNISHAYLFCGSRGTGKTSIARIFSHEIGCSSNDLYEIDAASNRGIDDVRALCESVNTLPFESKYKVYIIDEVHMLTKEAFNALLKTLEEPPAHVIFILATTELHKLPETIVSRCQTFTFRKPTQHILKDLVTFVAKKEGYALEPASAELIALLGDGSFRDTLGIVQKVISSSKDKKITPEEVEMVTGAPQGTLINSLIFALQEKNIDAALGCVREATYNNIDMKTFTKLLLHKMRTALLLRFAPKLTKAIEDEFSQEDYAFLKEIAEKGNMLTSATLQEFLAAYEEIGRTYLPSLPLELALVRLLGQNS